MMTALLRAGFAILSALVATSALAQSGGLAVLVLDDADGAPLRGARVTLSNSIHRIAETSRLSGGDGRAEFPILPAGGGYVLLVEMDGYAAVRNTGLTVGINKTQSFVIRLTSELVENVEVEARRDVADLEEFQHTTTLDEDLIENLPVLGRFYTNLLTLGPGVQDEDDDGNPNVHGARERDFMALVDGVSNVDPLTGLRLSNINIDAIEEMEVIAAGAGVEYGRAQGGFANIVEKQGGNELESVFSFTFRSSDLDGNGATGLSGDRIPEFDWLQPALVASGPIRRDRIWFFLAGEYLKREDPVSTTGYVSVMSTEQTTGTGKLTWQVTPRHKLAFSFLLDPLEIQNLGVSNLATPESTRSFEFTGPTYRLSWTLPHSPNVLLETLVAYQDREQRIRPTARGVRNQCVVGLEVLELAQCLESDSGLKSGSYFIDHRDRRERLTLKTRASIFAGRFAGTDHRLKLGFDLEDERYTRFLDRRPDFTFTVVNSLFGEFGIASTRFAIPAASDAAADGTSWAFYAEDQMRPAPGLTLTIGARVDREEIIVDGFGEFDPAAEAAVVAAEILPLIEQGASPAEIAFATQQVVLKTFTAYDDVKGFTDELIDQLNLHISASAGFFLSRNWHNRRRAESISISNTNFSPFVGFAWDPFGSGKTKIAATARRLYDKVILAVPLVEQEPVTTDVTFFALKERRKFVVYRPSSISPTANVSMLDHDLRTPYQDELTVSFERELAPETAVKLTYIRREFKDQIQDVDVNQLPGDFGRCAIDPIYGHSSVVLSPGEGETIVDPFTGDEYLDSNPGIGDGRLDDCEGAVVRGKIRPDGFHDLYVQNPGWGQVSLVGNFNTADYRAFVLELVRRQYRNWQMNASYTWSEAVGDAEDFNLIQGNDRTLLADERGFLSYDQTHVAKVNAVTIVPWAGGFRFGASVQWQSGLPFSVVSWELSQASLPPYLAGLGIPEYRARQRYLTGRRNDQRNEPWWNFDVHLAKELQLRGGADLQITVDVFNLLNDNSLRVLEQTRGAFLESVNRFGRRYQLGVRLAF